MAKKFPVISESAEELLKAMKAGKGGVKRQGLHILYLVQSGQFGTWQEIGQILGVGENAVGRG